VRAAFAAHTHGTFRASNLDAAGRPKTQHARTVKRAMPRSGRLRLEPVKHGSPVRGQ
jgi:hypothetical protein